VAKRFKVQGSNLELAALWQQRLDDEPTTAIQNRYDSRTA
jgi:iron complex outermembrane receptor protein